jgi:light-regulated signal transduction histidine kinase (bacteriophytochrome)
MASRVDSPAFGLADLTNCERELIHLAGSVQPHGALLLLHEGGLRVMQASVNSAQVLGADAAGLIGQPLAALGGDLADHLAALLPTLDREPLPLQCTLRPAGRNGEPGHYEGAVHRAPGGGVVVELEALVRPPGEAPALALDGATLQSQIASAVQRYTAAATIPVLAHSVVQTVRELTGYDRVMVYRFDPDGHGKIIAEARDPRLDSLLGHHYPASDIPQRARELYLKNRVRMLVDVDYEPQTLVPPLRPDDGQPLDMSMCQLRSMSPMHLQYLRNMGVTATLVASLVREGKLWGLIAAHHYRPRHLRLALRAAVDLLAEVASTRIAAIENYAHTQVALMVRRLEQRLIEATSTEGDWRQALFRNPRTLLQPLEATGAALFQGEEILTTGEVPSTPELRALCRWVHGQWPEGGADQPFDCSAVGKAHPPLASLTPTACGVLAVKLSTSRPDYLMWFRKEQLLTVTWAGDPYKPMEGNDPLQLSPRRSFEAWSEIVRGTAMPWSHGERMMGRAIGVALVDIIVQVHAVRLLIAEHQLREIRGTVGASREPVLVADPAGALLFANEAFLALRDAQAAAPVPGMPVAELFCEAERVRRVFEGLSAQPWRGELAVHDGAGGCLPVAVRAEAVPGRNGVQLGCVVTLNDLRDTRRTAEARRQLEAALISVGARARHSSGPADAVMGAILTNASLAAMDVADAPGGPNAAPLLEELEASAQRAATLYARLRRLSG